MLFLPGFSMLRLLFPRVGKIDPLERFALSIGVSVAVVALMSLGLNCRPNSKQAERFHVVCIRPQTS